MRAAEVALTPAGAPTEAEGPGGGQVPAGTATLPGPLAALTPRSSAQPAAAESNTLTLSGVDRSHQLKPSFALWVLQQTAPGRRDVRAAAQRTPRGRGRDAARPSRPLSPRWFFWCLFHDRSVLFPVTPAGCPAPATSWLPPRLRAHLQRLHKQWPCSGPQGCPVAPAVTGTSADLGASCPSPGRQASLSRARWKAVQAQLPPVPRLPRGPTPSASGPGRSFPGPS